MGNPLSEIAYVALVLLQPGAQPRQKFNAGLADRLENDGLVVYINAPSPYPGKNRGRAIPHLLITEAGREALAAYQPEKKGQSMAARKSNGKASSNGNGASKKKPAAAAKTAKAATKKAAAQEPRLDDDNDDDDGIAEAGHNAVKVVPRDVRDAVERIDSMIEAKASANGAAMERINNTYEKLSDALGVTKSALREAVAEHRYEKKRQDRRKEMEPGRRNEIEALEMAMADFKDMPLAVAAKERLERDQIARERAEGEGAAA